METLISYGGGRKEEERRRRCDLGEGDNVLLSRVPLSFLLSNKTMYVLCSVCTLSIMHDYF